MKSKRNEMSLLWTPEKVNDLISLYQKNECLWNILTEDYKSREKKDIAISSICASLNIAREQFSKKIHNLRNQFNYETKKVYHRNENSKNLYRGRWEYYEKLSFLKNVISPRPGPNYGLGYDEVQNTNDNDYVSIDNFQTDKTQSEVVHILDTKPGLEHNVVIYQETRSPRRDNNLAESAITSNNKVYPVAIQRTVSIHQQPDNSQDFSPHSVHKNGEQVQNKTKKNGKRQEMTTRSKKKLVSPSAQKTPPQHENDNQETQAFEISFIESPVPNKIIKRNSNLGNSNKIIQQQQPQQYHSKNDTQSQSNQSSQRDEYDLFGEFVASELRNMNHDVSRKKLKRRIMKAMLDTANEDDDSTD